MTNSIFPLEMFFQIGEMLFLYYIIKKGLVGDYEGQKWDAAARKYSSEAALSLRSRRSGTKFANPCGFAHLSADVFQGASYGILPCRS